jgi:hypothetical protein
LFITKIPAQAFNVTFNSGLLLNSYDNQSPDISINQTSIPNGFNNFFNDDFLLLGAQSNDSNIALDSHRFGLSSATSNSFQLFTQNNQDVVLEFDWIFQGNADDFLGLNTEYFSLALVNVDTSSIKLDLLLATEYSSGSYSNVIESGDVPAGNYTITANLLESADLGINPLNPLESLPLYGRSSAAGLGNVSIATVPFEFSPTLGIFLVGTIWGVSHLSKKYLF